MACRRVFSSVCWLARGVFRAGAQPAGAYSLTVKAPGRVPALPVQAVIPKPVRFPQESKSELLQDVPAPRVLHDGVGKNALHAQPIKGVSDSEALRLRAVSPALDGVVLQMDAELTLLRLGADVPNRIHSQTV